MEIIIQALSREDREMGISGKQLEKEAGISRGGTEIDKESLIVEKS